METSEATTGWREGLARGINARLARLGERRVRRGRDGAWRWGRRRVDLVDLGRFLGLVAVEVLPLA